MCLYGVVSTKPGTYLVIFYSVSILGVIEYVYLSIGQKKKQYANDQAMRQEVRQVVSYRNMKGIGAAENRIIFPFQDI